MIDMSRVLWGWDGKAALDLAFPYPIGRIEGTIGGPACPDVTSKLPRPSAYGSERCSARARSFISGCLRSTRALVAFEPQSRENLKEMTPDCD
jgi:hypothetical protein